MEKKRASSDRSSVVMPVPTVPIEVLGTMFEFLDGNGLLSCESVSYRWRCASDRTSLWKRACISAFPHLGDCYLGSAYAACSAYEGDWRETFLDGNRENRSTVVDWKMEAVAAAGGSNNGGGGDALLPDEDPEESQRRFFPPFSLCGYSFSLLADPRGNPRATNHAPAGGGRVEKGLSVYLTVLFQDEVPDTPPWVGSLVTGGVGVGIGGGGGAASGHGFPPPPLQLGPGHPWGADVEDDEEEAEREGEEAQQDQEEEEERETEEGQEEEEKGGKEQQQQPEEQEQEHEQHQHQQQQWQLYFGGVGGAAWGSAERRGSSPPLATDNGAQEENGGGGDATCGVGSSPSSPSSSSLAMAAVPAAVAPAAATVKRDPHGLRRRRRRVRTREGRLPLVSHVGDATAVARECCAAFSLSAVNSKDGRKDVMWVSSMKRDRFFPERSSWGVHCLVPTSTLQDPEEGFLKDGAATVRLRIRLLFLTAHVYTTADLASHRGFGVVAVRGNDRPEHFCGGGGRRQETPRQTQGAGSRGTLGSGPLSCLTFEILRCTTLEEMERLVARSLGVVHGEIRLWVITQPLTDGPLAPRLLLSGKGLPPHFFDDGQNSPSLFHLLPGDSVDEACRVRLWVEQRGDGGFWEVEDEPATGMSVEAYRSHLWQRHLLLLERQQQLQQVQELEETQTEQEQEEEEEEEEETGTPVHPSAAGRGRGGASGGCPFGPPSPLLQPPLQVPMSRDTFAGVRLSRTSEMPSARMQQLSTLVSSTSAAAATAEVVAEAATDNLGGSNRGGAKGGNGAGVQEERRLVFLKTLGLGGGGEKGSPAAVERAAVRGSGKDCSGGGGGGICGGSSGGGRPSGTGTAGDSADALPRYLTHAVLRGSSPLRSLFELAAELLQDGTAPEDLEAHVEDLPWVWQDAARRRQSSGPEKRATATAAGGGGRSSPVCGHGGPGGDILPTTMNRRKPPRPAYRRFLACPPPAAAVLSFLSPPESREQPGGRGGGCAAPTTLEEVGVSSGASVCFYRTGRRQAVEETYAGVVEGLVEVVRGLLRREGPLGRVHLIKLAEVIEICEALGYQGFRARIAHDQQRHVNPRETLEYVARGKHLAFICDSCGTEDFAGPRYHCLECPDYDLCEKCHAKKEPAPPHRYLFMGGHWRREGGFHGHAGAHEMEEIFPVPADGCDWRRRL